MSDDRVAALANDGVSAAAHNPITAIDILLEPDAAMIEHAQAANARLLKDFPKGFTLGSEHKPHVTLLSDMFTQQIWTRFTLLQPKY